MSKRNERPASRRLGFVLALALSCVAAVAMAERADRDKPINLEADRVTIDDAKKVSVFEGNVVLTQGTTTLKADRMTVREDAQGFQYGVAYGDPAYYREKRDGVDEYIEGWAQRIEYDGKAQRLQLFDQARLKRGADEVRGSYISYDQPTEFFRVVGAQENTAAGHAPGRVRAVIQPKSKDAKDGKAKPKEGAPPLKLKPAPALSDARK
ncbi:MAG: lipopolysaccharide transport periplasmic protein LptA [Burkholderiales bacterium]|nr:lipopolysaccharide transport periplasmic protein LptA [Burkholderiales bacterium]